MLKGNSKPQEKKIWVSTVHLEDEHNMFRGVKLLASGPELQGGGNGLQILREVTLRERDRKRVALC